MFSNRRNVTIQWGECDPAGIVYYPRYFEMFDISTVALFRAAFGCSKYELLKRFGFDGFPMVNTGAEFFIPSKFGDEVVIDTRIERLGRSSFDIVHTLLRGDDMGIRAHEKRVWVARHPTDEGKFGAVPMPAEVVERLSTPA
jgi:4-hydroxybenzoyl-CoA thioesterase